jgi:hypothetical protein
VDEDLVDAARMIRYYLPDLAGTRALEYDQVIAGLLADAGDGRDVGDELSDVLTASTAMHAWVARVLEHEHHLPPEVVRGLERGYQPLPGHGEIVDAEKFECPGGDYLWYRISVADEIPRCPTHQCLLVAS